MPQRAMERSVRQARFLGAERLERGPLPVGRPERIPGSLHEAVEKGALATDWLDAQGKGRMDFHIPPGPGLIGLKIWFAGFTVDLGYPYGVKCISNAVGLTWLSSQ